MRRVGREEKLFYFGSSPILLLKKNLFVLFCALPKQRVQRAHRVWEEVGVGGVAPGKKRSRGDLWLELGLEHRQLRALLVVTSSCLILCLGHRGA